MHRWRGASGCGMLVGMKVPEVSRGIDRPPAVKLEGSLRTFSALVQGLYQRARPSILPEVKLRWNGIIFFLRT